MHREALTPRTVYRTEEVLARVRQCREQGWSGNDEELEIGVRSLAVPVRDPDGKLVGGLSISVRAERMLFSEFREAFLPVLLRARDTLQGRLVRE
jgi:IclR family pca regulon transcriptional regulator